MHRKIAQPEAQQQPRETQLPSHFATHGNRRLRLVCSANRLRNELQHGWMQRVVHVGHGVVRAINRQRVLDQIVRTNRQKVETLGEIRQRQHGSRNFDHAANWHVVVKRHTQRHQLSFSASNKSQCLGDFVCVGNHRDQDAQTPIRARAQDGAQLRHEKLGLGKAQTNRAQPERWVVTVAIPEAWHAFIRPKVKRTDRDGATSQSFNHRPVGRELFVLSRQIFAV